MIYLFRHFGPNNCVLRANYGSVWLQKNYWLFRNFSTHFSSMIGIVFSNANNFGARNYRCQNPDFIEFDPSCSFLNSRVDGISTNNADEAILFEHAKKWIRA
jgi:hypothetical protein